MIKEIIYDITVGENAANVSTTMAEVFSQYEEVVIRAKVNGNTKPITVKLYISSPENQLSPTTPGYEYDYVWHMIPSKGSYYLHLTEALGNKLQVGALNTCNMKFEVLDSTGKSLESENRTISLYKTNTDISYQPDDLTQIFIALAELSKEVSNGTKK